MWAGMYLFMKELKPWCIPVPGRGLGACHGRAGAATGLQWELWGPGSCRSNQDHSSVLQEQMMLFDVNIKDD